jgi:hypothetical protein
MGGIQTGVTHALIGTNKEAGLEVTIEKTKHMLESRHQNAGQNQDIKIANSHLKMCHNSYHSVKNFVFSSVVEKFKN